MGSNYSSRQAKRPLLRRGIRLAPVGLAAALLLLSPAACALPPSPTTGQAAPSPEFDLMESQPDSAISPETLPTRVARTCPDLDSQLFQLTQADDPPRAAEELGFKVRDGKIQALLVLAGEDTSFLKEYGVELGTQSANQVQAFVPIDQLCELADSDLVLAVRPAAQAILQP
jgi:hypothetical protein